MNGRVDHSAIVKTVMAVKLAVRKRFQAAQSHRLAIIHVAPDRCNIGACPVFLAQLDDSFLAEAQRREASPQIAKRLLRQATIGSDNRKHAADRLAAVEQPDCWQQQSFLEYLGGARRH